MTVGRFTLDRHFTKGMGEGESVYDLFKWEESNVNIKDDDNKIQFVQKGVEFPEGWSPLARTMVASKYFYGEKDTSERECSGWGLINRVASTFKDWVTKQKYFDSKGEADIFEDELTYLTLNQHMSFNSPVWFNVGTHKIAGDGEDIQREAYIIKNGGKITKMPRMKERVYPQTSACFIQHVDDTMEDIMDLAVREALLFKYGSGTGTNLSSLRSFKEKLKGGGQPSGPMAYWQFYDKVAGIVKSGGKTRRAAKMDILDIRHPDILEFIESKYNEEKKIRVMIENGISPKDALESANYQNTNISVRITDDFMRAVEEGMEWQTVPVHNKEMLEDMPKYDAKSLFRRIAECAHDCADPGIQYHDKINEWHTCPNSGPINASNPCSEYMFIDDTSCNLASINLAKFYDMKEEIFDIIGFGKSIRITAIAQDAEIDNSSFPTKKIAENSYRFRPLGQGFANLGALLMSLGLPYDSDEARATAAALTAYQTGKVYETSTEMSEKLGAFKEFEKNKKPMLEVMEKHKEALNQIDRSKIPKNLENILDEAEKTWTNVIKRGKKYGFRNAQATVLAPTGTIGFMMDCDTKGVEPEMGLIQYKLLSDGGTIKLVNSTVEPTLKKIGYDQYQVEKIIDYINKNETIEGSEIESKHLPIFDCANKPKAGKRTISAQGHLKMMAAVQPFLSGAISKTVNLPKETTVEEIEDVYRDAWKMGLKAVALYRDGSKGDRQPLSFSKKGLEKMVVVRGKIPTTSPALRHKFTIGDQETFLHTAFYGDGNLGELFITAGKEGSTVGGVWDTVGILISIALQNGVPLEKITENLRHQKFYPSGLVYEGHPDIKTADSVSDYISQYLVKIDNANGENMGGKDDIPLMKTGNPISEEKNYDEPVGEPGGFCGKCGTVMHKRGHCEEVCPSCDFIRQTGCGG